MHPVSCQTQYHSADDYDTSPPPAEIAEAILANMPPPPPPIKRDPLDLSSLLPVVKTHIGDFKNSLTSPLSSPKAQETTMGLLTPFGTERLTVMELLAELLRTRHPDILTLFHTEKILGVCFDLFFAYPWNNLLHMVCPGA
jgi:hypothetical protein